MIDDEQWQLIGVALLQVLVSFVFFRLLQYIVRWYLFGKWYFPTFTYFSFIASTNTRANAAEQHDDNDEDDDEDEELDIESANLSADSGKVVTTTTPSTPITQQPLSSHKKWRICNEAVSLIHSIISGTWAVYACVVCPDLLLNMMSFTHALPTYLVCDNDILSQYLYRFYYQRAICFTISSICFSTNDRCAYSNYYFITSSCSPHSSRLSRRIYS